MLDKGLQQENVALREEIDKASMFDEIVGGSAPLKRVLSAGLVAVYHLPSFQCRIGPNV
jgi:hypothetical protein